MNVVSAADPNPEYLTKLRDLIRRKVKDGDLSDADLTAIIKAAAGYSGGMARARNRQKPKEAAEGDSLWVGFWLPPEIAEGLAIEGGEAPADLHMTLAYLGSSDGLPSDSTERLLSVVQAFSYSVRPVDITITGVDRFIATEAGGKDVIYATVDGEALYDFRWRLCMALSDAGLYPLSNHGEWVPHITLAYVEPGADAALTLPNIRTTLSSLTVSTDRDSAPETRPTFMLRGPNAEYGPPLVMSEASIAAMEPPARIPVLPKPGSYQHPVYGTIDMSPDRIAEFVSNFEKGVYQNPIPIDLEHETKLGGAAGWIHGLVTNGDGSVDAVVTWTDRGAEALRRDRYAYVSPEWYVAWDDPVSGETYENVLIGAALTARPFFKPPALRPLAANEQTEDDTVGSPGQRENPPAADNAELRSATEQIERQAGEIASMRETIERLSTENAALRSTGEQAAAQSQALAERLQTIEADRRRERYTAEVMGTSPANGTRWFGETAAHVAMLEHLAGPDGSGEAGDIFQGYVKQQRALGERMRSASIMTEIGSSGEGAPSDTSALGRAREAARKMRESDPKLTEAEALDRVLSNDAALSTAYYEETTGRRLNRR